MSVEKEFSVAASVEGEPKRSTETGKSVNQNGEIGRDFGHSRTENHDRNKTGISATKFSRSIGHP